MDTPQDFDIHQAKWEQIKKEGIDGIRPPLTEVETQKESWEDLRNLFIETSWSSAGILNYNESSYERAKKIVDALISQALLSDRARIVEELKQLKLLDNWTDTGSIWNSALDKAISIIKESR